MAQFNWTYVADGGKRYQVGLFHGNKTGHLLVHCNSKVVLVDFNVHNSTDYSFFLDEELFELVVELKDGRFFYGFKINKEVDTPLNRVRKAKEKKHWRQSLVFFGIVILAAIIFTSVLLIGRNKAETVDKAQLLSNRGIETIAKVFIAAEEGDTLRLQYSFVAGNRPVQGSQIALRQDLQQNLPLESGDEFLLDYVPKRPRLHELHLDRPVEPQVEKYRARILAKHSQLHPNQTKRYIRCQLEIAFEQRGLDGLADFYYQDRSPEQNPHHNEVTYKRLVRDVPFVEAVERRCL